MNREQMQRRMTTFAESVVQLVEELPRTRTGDVLGRQLLRSGTSVAANYRAACRSRSRREFIAKLGIVEEEGDESQFWLDLIDRRRLIDHVRVDTLAREAHQLVAIVVASIRTARRTPRDNPQSAIRNPKCS